MQLFACSQSPSRSDLRGHGETRISARIESEALIVRCRRVSETVRSEARRYSWGLAWEHLSDLRERPHPQGRTVASQGGSEQHRV